MAVRVRRGGVHARAALLRAPETVGVTPAPHARDFSRPCDRRAQAGILSARRFVRVSFHARKLWAYTAGGAERGSAGGVSGSCLSLIHISEPTRQAEISYA